jgi:peptidyl-prolyl cis-trans isomerase C
MKKYVFFTLIIFICGIMAVGCQKKEKEPVVPTPSEKAVESLGMPSLEEADDSMIIATIDDTTIMKSEVDDEKEKLLRQFSGRFSPQQMAQIEPKLWSQALENLINFKLLLAEADKKDIQAEEKAIEEQISQISGRFQTPDQFREQLAAFGMTEEKLRDDVSNNLKISALLESALTQSADLQEKEIEDFYKNHSENFSTPESVQASHILIKVEPTDGPAEKEQKRQKIATLQEEIKKGADFSQLAREHSDCPSKQRGGDLGSFSRGRMVKPFEDVAFQLKVGEVSGIVDTQFGYHLIKVTDRQEAQVESLEKSREKVPY